MTHHNARRVTPFGHPRITGCLLLPAAFRSLPRPSSPDSSEASTMDPYSLDHIFHVYRFRLFSVSQTLLFFRPLQSFFLFASYSHIRFSDAFFLRFLSKLLPDLTSIPRFLPERVRAPIAVSTSLAPLCAYTSVCKRSTRLDVTRSLLEARGFEPLTCGLQSHRSSQLSYAPVHTGSTQ